VRKIKRLTAVTALALAAVAVTASVASAEVKWSHGSATFAGTLTLKRAGGNATTCTFTSRTASISGNYYFAIPLESEGWTSIPCGATGKMAMAPAGSAYWVEEAGKTTGYYLGFGDWGFQSWGVARPSAWPGINWYPSANELVAEEPLVPWTNGVGATPTKITFNNTRIGETTAFPPQAVTATGTLTVLNGKTNVTLSGK
jgi:hypothetical protein